MVASVVVGLGNLFRSQGRVSEAESFYKRAIAIYEKAGGPTNPASSAALGNLAGLYSEQLRYAEAEELMKRGLAILDKQPKPNQSELGTAYITLGNGQLAQGRYRDADEMLMRGMEILEKDLGPDHRFVAMALLNLATSLGEQRKHAEAEAAMQRALTIFEKQLGPDHPFVAVALNSLAELKASNNDWSAAVNSWQRSVDLLARRANRTTNASDVMTEGRLTTKNGAVNQFVRYIKAADRAAGGQSERRQNYSDATFKSAQWSASTSAAAALQQMAIRQFRGNPALAAIIRDRQDLNAEWQKWDKLVTDAASRASAQRDFTAEAANSARMKAIDARIAAIDGELAVKFPEFVALASPAVMGTGDVQSQLAADEALVLILETDQWKTTTEKTFVWVVTKTDVRWVRSELGTPSLQREVPALRCGLDYVSAWLAKGSRCKELTGFDYTVADYRQGKPLPFDHARAHGLYKSLFGEVEDLIKGKHLLVVPSGPLTQLPFQVLITKKPTPEAAELAWFARSNAITVLPAVSSLKALRQNAKVSAAKEPFIGFGNPMLIGQPACGNIIIPETCPEEELKLASASTQITRSVPATDAVTSFYRNGLANVAAVRSLCPLPDTAFELKCVAKSLGAPSSSIVVGKDMTERALKKAPLNDYRIIHFATHGLLAGETAKLSQAHAEPALVMSPPDTATEEDDGLLTASEIAALKLDADWVVMSACNTAGGGEQGAEALSGLARAFFYAGARALLVSHWPVNSYAATMLTSRTFAELRKDTSIGRSEAFRRAMIALMDDKARPWAAHPSVWAPFIVVGEGAAPK